MICLGIFVNVFFPDIFHERNGDSGKEEAESGDNGIDQRVRIFDGSEGKCHDKIGKDDNSCFSGKARFPGFVGFDAFVALLKEGYFFF